MFDEWLTHMQIPLGNRLLCLALFSLIRSYKMQKDLEIIASLQGSSFAEKMIVHLNLHIAGPEAQK